MAKNLKELTSHPELLTGGHRACAGCTGSNILRQIMLTAGKDTVVGGATGCMEVITTIFPYTAWRTSFIHSAFENCAATISGVETAFKSLKKHGELPREREKMNFIAFGGDGGTYDIGLQSLSGAMERWPRHGLCLLRQQRLHEYGHPAVQRHASRGALPSPRLRAAPATARRRTARI